MFHISNLWAYVFWSPLSKWLEVKVKQRRGVPNSSIKSCVEKGEWFSLFSNEGGYGSEAHVHPAERSHPQQLSHCITSLSDGYIVRSKGGKSGEECFLPESVSTLVFVGCTRWLSALRREQGPNEQNRARHKFFGGRMIHRIIKIGRIIWASKHSCNAISAHE